MKKNENKLKRGRVWPIFLKKNQLSCFWTNEIGQCFKIFSINAFVVTRWRRPFNNFCFETKQIKLLINSDHASMPVAKRLAQIQKLISSFSFCDENSYFTPIDQHRAPNWKNFLIFLANLWLFSIFSSFSQLGKWKSNGRDDFINQLNS